MNGIAEFNPIEWGNNNPEFSHIVDDMGQCWECIGVVENSIQTQLMDYLHPVLEIESSLDSSIASQLSMMLTQPLIDVSDVEQSIRTSIGSCVETALYEAATTISSRPEVSRLIEPQAEAMADEPKPQPAFGPAEIPGVASASIKMPDYARPTPNPADREYGFWEASDICSVLEKAGLNEDIGKLLDKFTAPNAIREGKEERGRSAYSSLFSLTLPGIVEQGMKVIVDWFEDTSTHVWHDILRDIKSLNPNSAELPAAFIIRAVFNLLGIAIGDAAEPITTMARQIMNVNSPFTYPSPQEAVAAYLANEISRSDLEHWVKLQGYCPEPYGKVVSAARSKLNPDELARLMLRGKIDKPAFYDRIRQLGYVNRSEAYELEELAKYIPPPTDTVRFMVRDVEDEDIVTQFNLDDEFEKKYHGVLEKFGEAWGIDRETMLRYWRAHWVIPGPHQLYEMLHRLSRLPEDDKRYVDEDMVRTALKQQDILPDWIEPLMAVSYTPITRVDIRRMYDTGVFTKLDVIEAYQQIGYSKLNAERLASFTETIKNRGIDSSDPVRLWKQWVIDRQEAVARLNADGYDAPAIRQALQDAEKMQASNQATKGFASQDYSRPKAMKLLVGHGITEATAIGWLDEIESGFTTFPTIKRYEAGRLSRGDTKQSMIDFGYSNDTIARIISLSDERLDIEFNAPCVKYIKDRMRNGEINEMQARAALIGYKFAGDYVDRIIDSIKCQMNAEGKAPTTAQLCQWLELGIINGIEFVDRLENIGWSPDDALNVAAQCISKLELKQRKQLEAQMKEEQKELERQKREREKLARENKKKREAAAKAREAARKARLQRERQVLSAGFKLAGSIVADAADGVAVIKELVKFIQEEHALTYDEAIQAATLSAEKGGFDSVEDYAADVNNVAAEINRDRD